MRFCAIGSKLWIVINGLYLKWTNSEQDWKESITCKLSRMLKIFMPDLFYFYYFSVIQK